MSRAPSSASRSPESSSGRDPVSIPAAPFVAQESLPLTAQTGSIASIGTFSTFFAVLSQTEVKFYNCPRTTGTCAERFSVS